MNEEILPGPDDVILVDDVFKTYHLGEVSVPAVRGMSLTVKKGDFLMITGRNGSGPTPAGYSSPAGRSRG
jgi:energy-coupling factor transporter ATP-binding protein EcfA2